MNIEELTIIYHKWGKENNIQPLLSADELLSENVLNKTQTKWLKEFIIVWDWIEGFDNEL
tara:strand:- start:482 stop:661 length:180 start_codon:yes stop_codon:yes gene_type:complete